jgi:hypothetical protein
MKELIIKIDEKGNIIDSKPYTKASQRSLLGDIGTVNTSSTLGVEFSNSTIIKLFLLFAMCVAFFLTIKKLTAKT